MLGTLYEMVAKRNWVYKKAKNLFKGITEK